MKLSSAGLMCLVAAAAMTMLFDLEPKHADAGEARHVAALTLMFNHQL